MNERKVKFMVINVGNTRTHFACFDADEATVVPAIHDVVNDDVDCLLSDILKQIQEARGDGENTSLALALASVNDAVADPLKERLEVATGIEVFRLGDDLPVPIEVDLEPETIVGVDRLLNALAVQAVTGRAAVVVDAGTAITVDYVDDDGVFHGGAILPGVQMMLDALHGGAALLPDLQYQPPNSEPWGRNTAQAMLHGVHYGARGAVRLLAERYAEHAGAYPQVIATGGDAKALFTGDELVERIVPHLALVGMGLTCMHALQAGDGAE